MSFAYLALFTGDDRRDTRHLTPLKHGIYLLLLMHCWDQKGPLPLDEQECAGIANCRSADEIDSLRYVLNKYFVKLEDGWYNNRMNREIEKAENISGIRSKAGKLGYKARAKQMLSKSQASAKLLHLSPSPSPSLSLPPSLKSEALASSPKGLSAPASPIVIEIPINGGLQYPVTQAMVDEWAKLYPDCDVLQTLREVRGWNLANPTKRKTKSGVMNHINRWLAKEHNRG